MGPAGPGDPSVKALALMEMLVGALRTLTAACLLPPPRPERERGKPAGRRSEQAEQRTRGGSEQ